MRASLTILLGLCTLWPLSLGEGCGAAPLSYHLQLTVEPDGRFQGQSQIELGPLADLPEVLLRLYPNQFGDDLLTLSAASCGEEVPWDSVHPTVVSIFLPSQGCQTLSLSFAGALPRELRGYGIFAISSQAMALSQFYPILAPWDQKLVHPTFSYGDNLVAEVADYTLELSVPEGWTPVASGEERFLGDRWKIEGQDLRELGLVLVQGYEVEEGEFGEVLIRSHFPPQLRRAGEKAVELVLFTLPLYTERLGDFPYPSLDLVILPLRGAGGVEYPGLILIAEEYAADPDSEFYAEIVAHELAHQWWYGEVGTDQVGEPWLDEALATFSSSLLFEAWGRLGEMVMSWEGRWERAKTVNPAATVGSALWEFPQGLGYSGYVYSGGALFLQRVRERMGDDRFFGALRRFREEERGKIARASDFLRILQEESPVPLADLIAQFFGG